ncbi:EAL domain-containing protein [Rhizobium sp. AN80A]|uniref:EAL domain-containing protein n=2 Tax=unclassified Rhizobium TaxID=2613769 RepID=UPI000DD78EEB|nr:EAL domain-containing protein [Rhizobium sp. AN80A]
MIAKSKALWRSLGGRSGSVVLRLALIASMIALPLVAPGMFVVQNWNDNFVAKRFQMAPRSATGTLAFIAIDKKSLDAIGIWPWPRGVYAELIDRISAAGAGDIFIDVDFSTPSQKSEDDKLAAGLDRAGGSVLLPIFRQQVTAKGFKTTITKPIGLLAEKSWPVFANVALDLDGNVRRFSLGEESDAVSTQSAAASLAKSDRHTGTSLIDFSIRPDTVPTFSLSDVLNGHVGADALRGRSIVVGASATELKDIFPVPIYSVLAGPMIHVLAAETLLQNRDLRTFNQLPLELFFSAVLIVVALTWRSIGIASLAILTGSLGLLIEIVAFLLQKEFGFIIGTAVPWLILSLSFLMFLNERLDFGQMLLVVANVERKNTRRLMERIIQDSSDGVIAFDGRLKIIEASQSAKQLFNTKVGNDLFNHADPTVVEAVQVLIAKHCADPSKIHSTTMEFSTQVGARTVHLEVVTTISPNERTDATQHDDGFAGCLILRDVTARRLYHERLRYLAEHDELTGLLNRREFAARLDVSKEARQIAVLDVERFSGVCATLGRDTGDDVLRAIATHLRSELGEILIARLAGDIFAVALSSPDLQEAERVASRLLDLFTDPIAVGFTSVPVGIRVGIAQNADASAESRVREAESALDLVRSVPGRQWAQYDPASAVRQARARRLEADMREALVQSQFFLLYQPQIELASGRLIGAEALIRWQHPEFGLISPLEFIPIAESTGLICEMGRWTLMEACTEAANWPGDISVAVNVSPIQFARSDVEASVQEAIAASGLAASRLCLELTESTFLEQGGPTIEKMRRLRGVGISIALDDFGTGYSSMSYLASLPLDKLKIDQSFVRVMNADGGALEIVKAVVSLAHGLKLAVVAEGIEGKSEVETLQWLGCETGQGYLFGKPQAAQELFERTTALLAVGT